MSKLTAITALDSTLRRARSRQRRSIVNSVLRKDEKFIPNKSHFKNKKINLKSINFFDLDRIFTEGAEVYTRIHNELVGGKVYHSEFQNYFGVNVFILTILVISQSDSGMIAKQTYRTSMRSWEGTKKIEELSIRLMVPDIKSKLEKRGRFFREIVEEPSYLNYSGSGLTHSWWNWYFWSATGRVMVDGVGNCIMDPDSIRNLFSDLYKGREDQDDDENIKFKISDEELFMTWPIVAAFSFRQKKWLGVMVSNLTKIEFDHEIFEKLVLDQTNKKIIKSLVEHSDKSFTDIVGGKSGGFIFLLHGPPGTGKTLTAEATAEKLNKPLYVISMGELGTNIEILEKNLKSILELIVRWDGVLLLDEADVFLEQRTEKDLERNAMVSVFLRLLEYFNGVLFLTTNRVKNFDKAFHSRISLAINYPSVNKDVRFKIWQNLLEASGFNSVGNSIYAIVNINELSKLEINGRQIKNCIRLAQTLAFSDKIKVTTELLKQCALLSEKFTNDLNKSEDYC